MLGIAEGVGVAVVSGVTEGVGVITEGLGVGEVGASLTALTYSSSAKGRS